MVTWGSPAKKEPHLFESLIGLLCLWIRANRKFTTHSQQTLPEIIHSHLSRMIWCNGYISRVTLIQFNVQKQNSGWTLWHITCAPVHMLPLQEKQGAAAAWKMAPGASSWTSEELTMRTGSLHHRQTPPDPSPGTCQCPHCGSPFRKIIDRSDLIQKNSHNPK